MLGGPESELSKLVYRLADPEQLAGMLVLVLVFGGGHTCRRI